MRSADLVIKERAGEVQVQACGGHFKADEAGETGPGTRRALREK
jgi:hypothetical protein